MTIRDQAASMSQDEIVTLLLDQQKITKKNTALLDDHRKYSGKIATLTTHVDELQRQLDWFKRQLFGTKSDRRILPENTRQFTLGESLRPVPSIYSIRNG